MGVVISKRQVVRLLTAKLETFRAEDEAVLKAGLGGAYVTVDDTGARHAGQSGYTTQIGMPASSALASMRCAGFTPNASSTNWFPPTTSIATPSRSPSG